ncbi:MAG: VWA domain-containing protein, partial [Hyphomicrobiales bacterium]|nr:VWA domain-containing protein [Hyphomicrobiales bacterium]
MAERTTPDRARGNEAARDEGGTRARLVFALDATLSRKPTWDLASGLQADMFESAAALGGLDVQLVYFRGADECKASRFVT